ncbi:MAG: Jag family protein [Elusimicrobiales bacterium]
MRETKAEAKTIQDAVEKGLAEMGLRRDQVEVVVVNEGKSGFLGLIGAQKACVILREKRWGAGHGGEGRGEHRGERGERGGRRGGRGERGGRSGRGGGRGERGDSRSSAAPRRPGRYGYEDARLPPPEENRESSEGQYENRRHSREDRERTPRADRVYKEEPLAEAYSAIQPVQDPVEHAKAVLVKLVALMGMEATVTEAKLDTTENLLFIRFDCPDSAAFTGDNGRGLQSLQFVLNSIVSRKREPHLALRLDTGGYWDSKEKEIADRVEEGVGETRARNVPFRMDPMPASMRKIVHNLVKTKYPDMETVSEGEGRWRKVVIRKIETSQPEAEQAAAPAPEQPAETAQPAEAAQPAEQTTEQK